MATASSDQQSELCEQLVTNIPDAIIFADHDGIIRLWNAGAEALFGYSAAEAIGQTLDLIIPERLRGRHWAGYRQVMASGVTRYGRELLAVPAQHRDGQRLSLEFSIALLRDASGAVRGAAAVLRDVTTRFQEEKALRERVAAAEAQLRALSPAPPQ
jgi:PAS domain S-box-containing protein